MEMRSMVVVGTLGVASALLLVNGIHQPMEAADVGDSFKITALELEVNRLKGLVPDQSHAMKDVAYHFANLWFAAEKKNWPLADFYWSETRSHLEWAVRIIPVRKNAEGQEIRLQEILEPIKKTALEDVHKAITAKDRANFEAAYKQMLSSCYACHLAAGKPFLRLQIPTQPEVPIVKFEPE
jgi:hypothetical protein